MKDIAKMRLGVIAEFKSLRKVISWMETRTKNRNAEAIQLAYIWLKTIVAMMEHGELAPEKVALNLELARALQEDLNNE